MKTRLQSVAILLFVLAATSLGAKAKKPGQEPANPVEQAAVDRIMAADAQANPQFVRNPFCPITGKPVDPAIAPVDCPQKFQHVHKLVGVSSKEAADAIAAAAAVNKSNKWLIPDAVVSAASNNMLVDLSNPRKPFLKPLVLAPELRAPVPAPKDVAVQLVLDAGQKFQTIDGFGTATYAYNRPTHETYAKPEFQKLIAQDLGMSMIRFELVPAHFKPVKEPAQISRKDFVFDGTVEGIPLNEKTGKPAFGPVKGVLPCLEFIAAIKKLNPDIKVTPSVWSPPAWMKTTGKPAGGGALKPEYYAHYAQYLVEWTRHVKEKYGFDLYAIGPQNELEFSEPYNSCIYKPEEFREMIKVVGQTFQKEGLNVKLFGPEDMTHYGPRTARFINIVEDDPQARPFLHILATHGYADGIQLTGSVKESQSFWELIKQYKKPYWQTETGTGAADDGWNDGGPDGKTQTIAKDGSRSLLQGALSSVGGRLHYALVYGQASAWLFWQISGNAPSVHCLMVGDQPGKKYYVARHFYRWVRPGAVRIAAGPDGGEQGVCVSAFEHAADKTLTIVLLNRSNDNAQVKVQLKATMAVQSLETYRTSETENGAKLADTPVSSDSISLTLPPRCIVTLQGKAP